MDYIKQPGIKNPLSKEEIKYYTSKLEDRYTIGEQIGVSSAKTSTYLLHHESKLLPVHGTLHASAQTNMGES